MTPHDCYPLLTMSQVSHLLKLSKSYLRDIRLLVNTKKGATWVELSPLISGRLLLRLTWRILCYRKTIMVQ